MSLKHPNIIFLNYNIYVGIFCIIIKTGQNQILDTSKDD